MFRVKSVGGARGHWRDGRFFDREWVEVESLTAAQLADPRLEREEIPESPVEPVVLESPVEPVVPKAPVLAPEPGKPAKRKGGW